MNELQLFENPQFGSVRTIEEEGKVLFCGNDIAKALGYARPKDAVGAHCKGAVKRRTLTDGGEQLMNFIPEGDVYRLAAKSELPGADQFESWIFDEVIPTIRRTGSYVVEAKPEKKRFAGEAASLVKQLDRIARDKRCTPQERSEIANTVCGQMGISLPECFIRETEFEQVTFMIRK